jgi:hypothetical protein
MTQVALSILFAVRVSQRLSAGYVCIHEYAEVELM